MRIRKRGMKKPKRVVQLMLLKRLLFKWNQKRVLLKNQSQVK